MPNDPKVPEGQSGTHAIKSRLIKWLSDKYQLWIIVCASILGIALILGSKWFQNKIDPKALPFSLLLSIGQGLIGASAVSFILDLVWSQEKAKILTDNISPEIDKLKYIVEQLKTYEEIGLKCCHHDRVKALEKFYVYAENIAHPSCQRTIINTVQSQGCGTIDIVSSSARGLIDYLDRESNTLQSDHIIKEKWRELIQKSPKSFRFLLTHPAYAHLRQATEERGHGEIEMEILKTLCFLHLIAGMKGNQLRLYRGSPTVFSIQAGSHILLNPYSYGKMAMKTLCLEFSCDENSAEKSSYVADFAGSHFNHTWGLKDQPTKCVDEMPLVTEINSFKDILNAFLDCQHLGVGYHDCRRFRLIALQVKELDNFVDTRLQEFGEIKGTKPQTQSFQKELSQLAKFYNNKFLYDDNTPINNDASDSGLDGIQQADANNCGVSQCSEA